MAIQHFKILPKLVLPRTESAQTKKFAFGRTGSGRSYPMNQLHG
jgi:hypothetical protein